MLTAAPANAAYFFSEAKPMEGGSKLPPSEGAFGAVNKKYAALAESWR